MLRVKLKGLDKDNQTRREIADFYLNNINNNFIKLLPAKNPLDDLSNVWHIFPILSRYRTNLQNFLTENGIQSLIHYPIPPHLQEAYKEWNNENYPLTEKIHNEILSIPIYPGMQQTECKIIADTLNKFNEAKS